MQKESLGFNDEQLERHERLKAEKMATVLTGDDVIHLDYFKGLFDKTDVEEYEAELQKIGIRLSHFDKSGLVFANLDDYTLQVFFGISTPIVQLLGEGVLTNVVWESIKAVAVSAWKKVKTRNSEPRSKKINFGLKMQYHENRLTSFKLNSNYSEETTLKALDSIFQYMNNQKPTSSDILPDFCEYDESTNTWQKIDVMESFRKKAEEQRAQRASKKDK